MGKDQKGFIVYGDIKAVIDELPDSQVSQLFRGMVDYFVEGKDPDFDGVLKFVFIPIKQQMDRDIEKYETKCQKNRENIKSYWNKVKNDTNEYDRIRTNTNATNTNTNTNKNKNTNTNTTTNTNTDTNAGGSSDCDDGFDIWNRLTIEDVDAIYAEYPNSGGDLIETVVADVKCKKKQIRKVVPYILGYAKKVNWDDNEDHFVAPWEAAN